MSDFDVDAFIEYHVGDCSCEHGHECQSCTMKRELKKAIKELCTRVAELTEKYSCCGGKTSCANNQLRFFCDEIFALYEKDKDEAKERLGMIIETLETDRDWAKCERKELQTRLSTLLKVFEVAVGQIVDCGDAGCEYCHDYGKRAEKFLADFRAVKEGK